MNDGTIINLRIRDTAGQERFSAINENYYKKADCCLLVYDITSKDSFNRLKEYFIPKLKENCKPNIKVVLLGNKTDKKDKRKVSEEEGINLALKYGFNFMESSCKDDYNVSDAFTALVEMTNNEIQKTNNNVNINLNKKDYGNNQQKKANKCC